MAERKKVVKRVKRDRLEIGVRGGARRLRDRGSARGKMIARENSRILPRGGADIILINNACLRPQDDKNKPRELAQVSQLSIWVSGGLLFCFPATR